MNEQLTIPLDVQRHIMTQLMCNNDVEIRLSEGEFKVISLRKKCERFPVRAYPEKQYHGNITANMRNK